MPSEVDDGRLAAALSTVLGRPVRVEGLVRMPGGASRETWAFGAAGAGERLELVLRRDPPGRPGEPGAMGREARALGIMTARMHVALDGEGARLFGGRWNSPGVRVIYTSPSLALAAIETFVHLEPNLRPDDLVSIAAEIPDDIPTERLDLKSLPRKWHAMRDDSLRTLGDRWIRAGTTIALHVPSAAIRGEWNVLLNPAHSSFSTIKFQRPEPFLFDLRMYR